MAFTITSILGEFRLVLGGVEYDLVGIRAGFVGESGSSARDEKEGAFRKESDEQYYKCKGPGIKQMRMFSARFRSPSLDRTLLEILFLFEIRRLHSFSNYTGGDNAVCAGLLQLFPK